MTRKKTHKQNFATHPIPGQSLKFVYVYVFFLSLVPIASQEFTARLGWPQMVSYLWPTTAEPSRKVSENQKFMGRNISVICAGRRRATTIQITSCPSKEEFLTLSISGDVPARKIISESNFFDFLIF